MAFENKVLLFNVESEGELSAIGDVARSLNCVANVALRVNPDLPPKTHHKTDTSVKGVKFGLDIDTVLEFAQKVAGHPHVKVVGLAHASGLTDSFGRTVPPGDRKRPGFNRQDACAGA